MDLLLEDVGRFVLVDLVGREVETCFFGPIPGTTQSVERERVRRGKERERGREAGKERERERYERPTDHDGEVVDDADLRTRRRTHLA